MTHPAATIDATRESDDISRLVLHVENAANEKALRKFSVWCTRQMNATWKPEVYTMMRLAEEAISNEVSRDELQKTFDEMEGAAVAAESVEVYSKELYAPVLLAARACINPNASEGALNASDNLQQYYRILLNNQIQDLGEDDKNIVVENRIEEIKETEIDQLLDLMVEEVNKN